MKLKTGVAAGSAGLLGSNVPVRKPIATVKYETIDVKVGMGL